MGRLRLPSSFVVVVTVVCAAVVAGALGAAGCAQDDAGPCRSPTLTKGPWVMRTTDGSASIFWETASDPAGCVAAGVAPEGGSVAVENVTSGVATRTTVQSSYGVELGLKQPDLAGTYWVSRVDLTGLAPSSCYTYRVRQEGKDDARGRLCTTRPADATAPWKFMAIGDTNPTLGHTLPVLAHALPEKPDFVIHMGDMHYYSAISETWAYWFGAMAPMLRAGAIFPSVGNHEDEADKEPTDYADYYDRLFHQPSLDGTPQYYRFESGGIWFHSIDTEAPYDSASPQYRWLLASLEEVKQKPGFRFSVLYMHRNLYTLGDSAPQVDRRKELAPELVANKVRLVLSGHMHGYERFEVGDITYVTTAGGGAHIGDVNGNVAKYPDDVPLRVAAAPAYHATIVEVTPMGAATGIHGRAIDENGALVDEWSHVVP